MRCRAYVPTNATDIHFYAVTSPKDEISVNHRASDNDIAQKLHNSVSRQRFNSCHGNPL